MKRLTFLVALLAAFAATTQFVSPAQFTAPVKAATPASSGELQVRQDIFDRVRALVDARDFAGLNALGNEFRTTRARTPSGVWKLGMFHGAVHAAMPSSDQTQDCAFGAEPFLKAWMTATPDAPSPYIATATMLLDQAWCFRGETFAKDVPDGAWEPFHESLKAADNILSAHKKVAAQDPEFYLIMEDIYRAEGREPPEFQKLLDEATAKEPYYYGLYWHAFYYNMPHWFGGNSQIEQTARYAVERTRGQDGLGAYARYYWSASEEGCNCWVQAIDWDTMKLGMRDIAQRYPDPWNLAHFAKFGCMFNDREVARTYFTALGENDGSEAWSNDIAGWENCRAFAGLGEQHASAPTASR